MSEAMDAGDPHDEQTARESQTGDPHPVAVEFAGTTPIEIDLAGTAPNPEILAIEILRKARHRLSTGPSPCAADSQRLLARTAWLLFERTAWPKESVPGIRASLERLLPRG